MIDGKAEIVHVYLALKLYKILLKKMNYPYEAADPISDLNRLIDNC